jgi:hypothetical protein
MQWLAEHQNGKKLERNDRNEEIQSCEPNNIVKNVWIAKFSQKLQSFFHFSFAMHSAPKTLSRT